MKNMIDSRPAHFSDALFTSPSLAALMALAPLCLLMPLPALAADATLVVVSGRQVVQDGAQVCFRLDGNQRSDDRVVVRVRFAGSLPHGSVALDGHAAPSFSATSQSFAFDASVGDIHRLTLDLDASTPIEALSLTATASDIAQVACSNYETNPDHHVRLQGSTDDSVDRLEHANPPTDGRNDGHGRDGNGRNGNYGRDGNDRNDNYGRDGRSSDGGYSSAITVPAGTEIELSLDRAVSSQSARTGQQISTHLNAPVIVDGRTALPTGTQILGSVLESQKAGRFGRARLRLGFDHAVLTDGTSVAISGSVQRLGKGGAGKQAGIIAGSAVGGALAASALGSKPILGAVVGGGVAAGVIAAKPGKPVVLSAGTVLILALDDSVEIPRVSNRRWAQGDRQ
jgi:hypothetical protein